MTVTGFNQRETSRRNPGKKTDLILQNNWKKKPTRNPVTHRNNREAIEKKHVNSTTGEKQNNKKKEALEETKKKKRRAPLTGGAPCAAIFVSHAVRLRLADLARLQVMLRQGLDRGDRLSSYLLVVFACWCSCWGVCC